MATGFMVRLHSMLPCLALACSAAAAGPADDGGEPKTLKLGQRWNGITVVAVEKSRAVIEVEGVKRVLALEQHHRGAKSASQGQGRQSVTLAAGPSGHFVADGTINGVALRFMVDTGATYIALPGPQADALGIDYRKGSRGVTQTANGPVAAFRVRFDTVKVGGIEINGVEGIVIEKGLPVALLGMSFLNRVDMRREGDVMTLVRRF